MKKIGILTLYHKNYNFGGLLQAYALPAALNKYFNLNAEQIDYQYLEQQSISPSTHIDFKSLIYNTGIRFFTLLTKSGISKRKKAMNRFMNDIPHSSQTYFHQSISDCINQYDIYICGSDQIWNDDCQSLNGKENIQIFTLQFVPQSKKKLSYAASMAVLDTSAIFRQLFKTGLLSLDYISVREKQSIPILQQFTDQSISLVVDPVLLLDKNDWEKISRPAKHPQKYILCYLLGDNVSQRKEVSRISKELKLPVVTFSHIFCNVVRKCDLFFGDIHDYTSGPREFIDLIKNADLIITDSFHACVFSMIFERPFWVFERHKSGQAGNMNSRIYNFLEEYRLEQQLLSEEDVKKVNRIPSIDFSYAQSHLQKRRQESLDYLKKALEI